MQSFIVKRPIITEKSIALAKLENKFTFEVDRLANKEQVKDAIQKLYGVDVTAVNTIRGHRIMKATGRKRTKTIVAPTKKAVIELKKGQTIDLFEFGSADAA